jgi:hypothetical protein
LKVSYKNYSKKENDWYRQEIETCQKDTVSSAIRHPRIKTAHERQETEYIAYHESKQKEKQNVIDSLNDANRRDNELFNDKKKERETQNEIKINGISYWGLCIEMEH